MTKTTKKVALARRRTRPAMAADVARIAGVSVSAVSRTFTAGASVSEATRKKVLAAARTLKYRPAQSVQTPHLKGSHIIGVAVAELDDLYYAHAVGLLSDLLAEIGYRLLIFITHGKTTLDPVHRELLHFRVDALILATSSSSFSLADECHHFGIPVILFNNVSTNAEAATVAGANFPGGRAVGAFLLAGEHKRFAVVTGVDDTSMELEREAGFSSAIVAAGLPRPQRARGLFAFEGTAQATRKLLSGKERPDAIFCINDQMAIAALQTARSEFGLIPGKDISIVGFDDVGISSWPAFDLTTYSQPIERMVHRTVEILRDLLGGEPFQGVHEVVPGELIVRGSARLPPQGIETHKDGKRVWKFDSAAQVAFPLKSRQNSASEA